MRESASRYGRICAAPSEQLTPTISGSACSIESQNASAVCPDRFLPLWSTAVKESQRGRSGATSSAAAIAAFAFRVSKIVSIWSTSTPPSANPRICSAYAAVSSSNVIVRNAGSSTLGEMESVRLVGPTEPTTKRSSAPSSARRAVSAAALFMSYTRCSRP